LAATTDQARRLSATRVLVAIGVLLVALFVAAVMLMRRDREFGSPTRGWVANVKSALTNDQELTAAKVPKDTACFVNGVFKVAGGCEVKVKKGIRQIRLQTIAGQPAVTFTRDDHARPTYNVLDVVAKPDEQGVIALNITGDGGVMTIRCPVSCQLRTFG
jgi:hypothetical protein